MKSFLTIFASLAVMGICSAQTPKTPQKGITQIILQRTWCYGACPIDQLTLNVDGTATYAAQRGAEQSGFYQGRFWDENFKRLSDVLEKEGFAELSSEVGWGNIDAPDHILTVIRDGLPLTVINRGSQSKTALWRMETLIRGVSADIRWKKDEKASFSGIRGVARRPLSGNEKKSLPKSSDFPMRFAALATNPLSDDSAHNWVWADQEGRFQVFLPPGKYYLSAFDSSRDFRSRYHAESQTIEVKEGTFSEVQVDFKLFPPLPH